jgi:hypothetical protein
VTRARSIRRHRAIGDRDTPQAAPDAPAAGHAGTGETDREPLWAASERPPGAAEKAETVALPACKS